MNTIFIVISILIFIGMSVELTVKILENLLIKMEVSKNMYKIGKLNRFMKLNNWENYHRFIRNEISVKEIADKLQMSSQFVDLVLHRLDKDIFEKRNIDYSSRLQQAYAMFMEGLSVEMVIEQDFMKDIRVKSSHDNIHRGKDSLIALFKRHDIVDRENFTNFIFVQSKLERYILSVQIENAIKNVDTYDGNKAFISRCYDTRHQTVLSLNKDFEKNGRVLSNVDERVYDVIKRNVEIAVKYRQGIGIRELKKQYPNVEFVSEIARFYEPYVRDPRKDELIAN